MKFFLKFDLTRTNWLFSVRNHRTDDEKRRYVKKKWRQFSGNLPPFSLVDLGDTGFLIHVNTLLKHFDSRRQKIKTIQ